MAADFRGSVCVAEQNGIIFLSLVEFNDNEQSSSSDHFQIKQTGFSLSQSKLNDLQVPQ